MSTSKFKRVLSDGELTIAINDGCTADLFSLAERVEQAVLAKLAEQEPVWWAVHMRERAFATDNKDEAKAYANVKEKWAPLVTPLYAHPHAEAYAEARVREALEAAAKICDDRAMKNEAAVSADEPDEASSLRSAAWQMGVCASDIRALIPKENRS